MCTATQKAIFVCNDPSTIVTRQCQFQCIQGKLNLFGLPLYLTLNPTATLSTPLVDTCRRCIDDHQSSRADPTTHCDRESSIDHIIITLFLLIIISYHVSTACPPQIECNQGQRCCFIGQDGDVCCNIYLNNNYTDDCPSRLVDDSGSVCGEFLNKPCYAGSRLS